MKLGADIIQRCHDRLSITEQSVISDSPAIGLFERLCRLVGFQNEFATTFYSLYHISFRSLRLRSASAFYRTEKTSQTAERPHEVVVSMSILIPPGSGGIYRALQCMLTTSWFKGEGRMIDAWHALAAAVHEEQELGMLRSKRSL
jgi:hypothetical protein